MRENRNLKNIIIYTDGSALGNPGCGGYGCVLKYKSPDGKEYVREYSGGYKHTTNNRMELMSVIVALSKLTTPCHVVLYSDSKYLVDAFNKGWLRSWMKNGWKKGITKEAVKNTDLWKELVRLTSIHDVYFIWIKGHNDNPGNERCDQLAVAAASAGPENIDEGYVQEGSR